MLLLRCPECKTDFTLAQPRASDAFRCSSLCRRAYHTSCVAVPDDVLKLLLNPNILWQCDSCVVANNSHSKIDEFDDKLKALERLYQGLHNKFLEAVPPKDDALNQNVNPKPRLPRPTNVAAAPQSYVAAAATGLPRSLTLLIMLWILREEISYKFEIRGEGTTTSPTNMLLEWLLMPKIFMFCRPRNF